MTSAYHEPNHLSIPYHTPGIKNPMVLQRCVLSIDALNEQPGCNRMGDRNFVNVAPL
jgi:hypothetical protein